MLGQYVDDPYQYICSFRKTVFHCVAENKDGFFMSLMGRGGWLGEGMGMHMCIRKTKAKNSAYGLSSSELNAG